MPAMSFADFNKLAGEYRYVPVWLSIPGDLETPVSLVKKLGGCVYLLESVEKGEILGRYSFIGVDTLCKIEIAGQACTISGEQGTQAAEGHPLEFLAKFIQELNVAPVPELIDFNGGAVGYLGYGLVNLLEAIPQTAVDDLAIPDCKFVIAKTIIQLDHLNHEIKLIVLAPGGDKREANYSEAINYLKGLVNKLDTVSIQGTLKKTSDSQPFTANMSKEEFMDKVNRAKAYISAGDIFQVVLSQRFAVPVNAEPFEIYRRLRGINPSPYLYYLNFEDLQLIGSSPEMLVRVRGKQAETCPIAGTRPRGNSPQEDERLARDLLQNPKERAEHLMLVDLSRNDLGRVCKYGSVKLERFMEIERFSHVMHIVSRVKGELSEEQSPLDALKVCFPAGTVSGAPKIRAMEIIEELEPTRRGPYAGAIGYLSFDANLDSCITIRTILIKNNTAYIQAGAGIVADSDPETEYAETLNKARALMAAINPVEEETRFAVND